MEPARRWPAGRGGGAGAARRQRPAADAARSRRPPQQGLLDALASGALPRERLVEAVTRVADPAVPAGRASRGRILSTVDRRPTGTPRRPSPRRRSPCCSGACTGPLVTRAGPGHRRGRRGQQAAWLTDALQEPRRRRWSRRAGRAVHLVGYGDGTDDLVRGAAVTVAMDTPYVLQSATSPVRVATYSSTQVGDGGAGRGDRRQGEGHRPLAGRRDGLPASACMG